MRETRNDGNLMMSVFRISRIFDKFLREEIAGISLINRKKVIIILNYGQNQIIS